MIDDAEDIGEANDCRYAGTARPLASLGVKLGMRLHAQDTQRENSDERHSDAFSQLDVPEDKDRKNRACPVRDDRADTNEIRYPSDNTKATTIGRNQCGLPLGTDRFAPGNNDDDGDES